MSSFIKIWKPAKEAIVLDIGIRQAIWASLWSLFSAAPEKVKIFSRGPCLSLFFWSSCGLSASVMHSGSSYSSLVCTTAWSVLSIHSWKFPLWSLKRSSNMYFGSGIEGMTDFWSLCHLHRRIKRISIIRSTASKQLNTINVFDGDFISSLHESKNNHKKSMWKSYFFFNSVSNHARILTVLKTKQNRNKRFSEARQVKLFNWNWKAIICQILQQKKIVVLFI